VIFAMPSLDPGWWPRVFWVGVVEPPDGIIAASQVGRSLPSWRVAFPLDEILPSAVVRFAVIQDFLEPLHSTTSSPSSVRVIVLPRFAPTSCWVRSWPGMPPPRYGLTLETWNVLKMFILAGSLSVTACDDPFSSSP
jgi:hypothetical protein